MTLARRGQTLVLMALTMLLLVVLVCATLAIGMRAREKVELQTLADATAYSNAVMTARTYNTLAVWNRAQVSHMVVLAGAQSHISYSSWYLGSLRTTTIAAGVAATACGIACANPWGACMCPSCVNVGKAAVAFNNEFNQVKNRYKSLDKLAGIEARLLQSRAAGYGVSGKALYVAHMVKLGTGGVQDDLLKLAVPDQDRRGEYGFSTLANTGVTGLELLNARQQGSRGPYPSLPAAHGSRESEFIRNRGATSVIPPFRPVMIFAQNMGFPATPPIASGGAYFGRSRHDANERDAKESWADDHGVSSGAIVWGGCFPWAVPPVPTDSYVRSTHQADNADKHRWNGGSQHQGSEANVHTLGSCGNSCPSVWILRQELNIDPDNVNASNGMNDQWKQPKHVSALVRDYGARTVSDPWNLMFNMRFSDSGGGVDVDVGREKAGAGKSKQLAIATGITYYHRHMQDVSLEWQEPPNFFNPFWRATLVPIDVDASAIQHMATIIPATDAQLGLGVTALKTAGFKGFQ